MEDEQKTWNEKILYSLKEIGRPAKGAEIFAHILKVWEDADADTARVMITYAINHNVIFRLKYANTPSYYLHPTWTDEKGNLLEQYEFNRWTKEFTDKTTVNEQDKS